MVVQEVVEVRKCCRMMHTSFYLTYNHPQAKNVRMAGESVGLHSEFLVGYIKITTQESYNFTSQAYSKNIFRFASRCFFDTFSCEK